MIAKEFEDFLLAKHPCINGHTNNTFLIFKFFIY